MRYRLPKHHSLRNLGFFDEDNAGFVRTFDDDINFDFSTPIDWKWIQRWCECKDLVVSFQTKYRRYVQSFIRHLLSKYYRPATIQVRDMENMTFSIAIFDGGERIALDELNFFAMEDDRVTAR